MKRVIMNELNIGFIGLGKMGSRLAARLLNSGLELSLYDRDPESLPENSTAMDARPGFRGSRSRSC